MKPKEESDEAMEGVEKLEQSSASLVIYAGEVDPDQPVSQTMPDVMDGSQQSAEQLRLVDGDNERVESFFCASTFDLHSVNHTALDNFDESDQLLLSVQQREAISRRHPFKFIIGHYGSGKVFSF